MNADASKLNELLEQAEQLIALRTAKKEALELLEKQARDIDTRLAIAAEQDGDPEKVGRAVSQIEDALAVIRRRIDKARGDARDSWQEARAAGWWLIPCARRTLGAHLNDLLEARVAELAAFVARWKPVGDYTRLERTICADSADWIPLNKICLELDALTQTGEEKFSQPIVAIARASRVLALLPDGAAKPLAKAA